MRSQSSFEVVKLSGELDIGRREEIARTLNVNGPGPAILVDLSEATYADSTIIAQLLRFRGDAERAGRRTAVLTANPRFKRVLQYAGMADAFALFDDRARALTYLSSGD